jgi:hypothetical protein
MCEEREVEKFEKLKSGKVELPVKNSKSGLVWDSECENFINFFLLSINGLRGVTT